jgi:ferredoxin
MLYIDPDYCTCCSACIPECPVGAIYSEDEVPADQKHFIALNAQMARICPPITQKKIPLAGSGVGSNFRSGTP